MGRPKSDTSVTTILMNNKTKEKSKIYIAQMQLDKAKSGEKFNYSLGKLVNDALDFYLSDVIIED